MIRTHDLTKHFDEFKAVEGVTLEVGQSEVLALLGPNGAGKTTTVRMLTSILKPTRGTAIISGYDVVNSPRDVRASVGLLTETHGLYRRMPAQEYLEFFGDIYGLSKNEKKTRIDKLIDEFGLEKDRNRRIGEFSKGMKQKLALARAMIHRPKVLLLDEPTSAMDPESARQVRNSIKSLRVEERSVIICTHNLAEAEELADRIAIIRHGQIIASGSPAELKQQMLGLPKYLVEFSNDMKDIKPDLPKDVTLVEQSENQLVLLSSDPRKNNPEVLKKLMAQGLEIIRMEEQPQSLESVYLEVMSVTRGEVSE